MRILQIFNQYRFRGGEEAWVDAIPKLLGESAVVDELRFRSKDWSGNQAPSVWRQARLMGDNPGSRSALRDKVRTFHPDLLLFHNVIPVGSFGLYDEARILGLPVMQYIHNFRPFSPGGTLWAGSTVDASALQGNPWPEILAGGWQESRVKTALLAWHMNRAMTRGWFGAIDHWVAPSEFMRDKFIEAGVAMHNISVVPHCYSAKPAGLKSDEKDYYLYLGRLETDKGICLLIDAWEMFRKTLEGKNIVLKIAGSGRLESMVREIAARDSSIECLGYLEGDQKNRHVSECRGVIIPSICWESLGLTAYEAYASGRPVIASRAGALQETVTDGITGWTHVAGDAQDLARALHDAEAAGMWERERRGSMGRAWLDSNADPNKWRLDFLALCVSAMEEHENRISSRESILKQSKSPESYDQDNHINSDGGRLTRPPVLGLSVYLGDQNPGFGRSFGISRMSEAVLSALAERDDVELHLLVSKTSQQGPLRAASRRGLLWGTRNRFMRLLSDHLHPLFGNGGKSTGCSYYPKGFLPWFGGRVTPTVVTIHDTIIDYYREHYPSWRRSFEYKYWCGMLKHTLLNADCILTVSESSKRQIECFMSRNGIPGKTITVTYEPCLYESTPQPENPKKGDYVVHLASREPHKRTAQLVRWWLESEPARRPTLHLVGHLPTEVSGFACSSPYLTLRPYLGDAELRAEIMGAKALILPSEIEGFGLPALEAYYLGTPVCYRNGTSVEEILAVATSKGGFDMDDPDLAFLALDEVIGMTADEIYACGLRLRDEYASTKVAQRMMDAFTRSQKKPD